MNTSFPRSIRDVALDLINAAETLAEMRLDLTHEGMRDTMCVNQERYFAERDRANALTRTGLSSSTEPASVSALRVSIPFAGEL